MPSPRSSSMCSRSLPRGPCVRPQPRGVAPLRRLTRPPVLFWQAIAGGSDKEFKSLKEGYESDLSGVELELYQAYLYGAEKIPQTEDPRASLRPLFESKMSDNLIKFAQSNGISPKVYDARGDGLTNTGKGGVLKGCRVLLDGWKSKGFIQDYTLDTSCHDENAWQQV